MTGAGVALLATRALTLKVGPRTLFEGLSVEFGAGQVWCVIGANGCGKTSLLHALAGLRRPEAGGVELQGRPLSGWTAGEAACLRGLLPQSLSDAFSATALELVLMGRHPHLERWAWEGESDFVVARAALAAVDMLALEGRDATTLSGGERQRVGIASLLAQDPLLLLLDEPLAHLDLRHQILVLGHLRELALEGGKCVVLSIHDLNLARRFATHALVLGGAGPRLGPVESVMDDATLSAAFGHAVSRVQVGSQWLFVAA